MKIELSSLQSFCLAWRFAEGIHGEIIARRLNRVREPGDGNDYRNPDVLAEISAAVRSVGDGYQRQDFASTIRYCLRRIKAEKNTPHRWQDYVASVTAQREEERAA